MAAPLTYCLAKILLGRELKDNKYIIVISFSHLIPTIILYLVKNYKALSSQKLGSDFEILTRDFFLWLFDKIDLTITKDRIQTSGTQDGFDIQIQISKNFILHNIYIECKNYSSGIAMGHIFQKAIELETNYPLDSSNDLFIAINSKSIFKNKDNPEKTKQTINDKFDFECQMLDISNGIEQIFALNNQFYKEVYGKEPDFKINEGKIIDKFKSIIFSNAPFKKVFLKEEDRFKFIGDIKHKEQYIERSFSKNQNILEHDFRRDVSLELNEIVNENDKIFILGNPGAGKTTSLKQFAYKYWNIGEQNSSTPIFKNLKNFTYNDTIESKLPSSFYKLKNVILIFDGIDEIADVENFISKLEEFLKTEAILNIKLKCVISCRTNVYESIVRNISGFTTFFLKDFNYEESLKLLTALCTNPISHINFNQASDSFLNNPFKIEILSTYINTNNQLPTNSAILWETYIEERLKSDSIDKQKRKNFNSILVINQSQKISLINELMRSSVINEHLLLKILSNNPEHLESFKLSPLIDIISGTSDWYFEHRNIQEYFAAKLLSNQSLEEILSFIQILDKKRTHPSLFNSITFLVNILDKDSDKYSQFINWLVVNEPEILFKADYNRIDEDLKIKVFQTYFQRVCVEQTLWIDNNGTFQVNEIALFASCASNYSFLTSIIDDYKKYHFRTIYSALDLLKYFNITFNKVKEFKLFLIDKLKEKDFDIRLKSEIIRVIYIQKLAKKDKEYLNEIFNCFKKSTHKELNRSLMNLILELNDIDYYYDFIHKEFLLVHNIKKREIEDDVLRGSEHAINDLIFKIKDANKFLEIIKYHFTDQVSIYTYNEEEILKKILNKIISYLSDDEKYIEKLLSKIDEDFRFHSHESLLKQIIIQSNTRKLAIDFLLNSFKADKVRHLISSIVDEDSLKLLCDRLIELNTEHKEIEYWRNNIGNSNSRLLSERFHILMKKKGVSFKESAFTEKKAVKQIENFKSHVQENFNILFDKKKLKSKIRYIFKKHGHEINQTKIRKIKMEWYDKNGHWNVLDAQIDILGYIIASQNGKPTNMAKVNSYLEDDFVLIRKIQLTIERYKSSNRNYEILGSQISFICKWSIEEANNINFDNVARASGPNSFYYLNDYKKIETIFFFQNLFDIKLPKEFLLSCIKFYEFTKTSDVDEEYAKLKVLINDNGSFEDRIISNIKNETLIGFSKSKHMEYAVNNNLTSVFDYVRKYFKDNNSMYNQSKIIEKYVSITNDVDLLKECSTNVKEHLSWTSINILMDLKKEPEYCYEKAIEYLELNEERYRVDALQTLFMLNHPSALPNLIKLLQVNIVPSFSYIKYNNFNNIESINDLKTFFNLIYKAEFDAFESHTYRNFFNYLINIFSIDENNFEPVQLILNEVKEELSVLGSDMFYINRLIDDSLNSFINSKSAIYTFEKALSTVEKLH